MTRAFLRSFAAHSYSYATEMIDKNAPSGRVRSNGASAAQAPTVNITKKAGRQENGESNSTTSIA